MKKILLSLACVVFAVSLAIAPAKVSAYTTNTAQNEQLIQLLMQMIQILQAQLAVSQGESSVTTTQPNSVITAATIDSIQSKGNPVGTVHSGGRASIYGSGLAGKLTIQLGSIEPRYVQAVGTSDTFATFEVPEYSVSSEVSVRVSNASGVKSNPYNIKITVPNEDESTPHITSGELFQATEIGQGKAHLRVYGKNLDDIDRLEYRANCCKPTVGRLGVESSDGRMASFLTNAYLLNTAIDNLSVRVISNNGVASDWVTIKVVVGLEPSITVLTPNGGEIWKVGQTQKIKWSTSNLPRSAPISIELQDTRYSGDTVEAVSEIAQTTNSGTYTWTIPESLNQNMPLGSGDVYKVWIRSSYGKSIGAYEDGSRSTFSITDGVAPTISSAVLNLGSNDEPDSIRIYGYNLQYVKELEYEANCCKPKVGSLGVNTIEKDTAASFILDQYLGNTPIIKLKVKVITTDGKESEWIDVVISNDPAPTVSISGVSESNASQYGNSIVVPSGSVVTLNWGTENASSGIYACSASGDWSGYKAVTGVYTTGPLSSSKKYTLTCTNPSGTKLGSNSVSVTVSN